METARTSTPAFLNSSYDLLTSLSALLDGLHHAAQNRITTGFFAL
jgi:hypothetical protein